MDTTGFRNPQFVEFDVRRWYVRITIIDQVGVSHEFIASADSAYADSGIYFASGEEYAEAERVMWER